MQFKKNIKKIKWAGVDIENLHTRLIPFNFFYWDEDRNYFK